MARPSSRRRFLKQGSLFVPAAFAILRARGQNIMSGPIMRTMATGGAPSYLLSENFEGTGTPAGWTDRAPINYDSGTPTMEGSQCMAPGVDGGSTSPGFTPGAEVWAYCLFEFSACNGDNSIFRFQDSGAANLCSVNSSADLRFYPRCGATAGGQIGSALSTNTLYHVWMHYKNNGGATSVCDIEFATDGIRLGSGNFFVTMTGTTTTDANKLFFYNGANITPFFDKVRVDDVQIGDNPS